VIFLAGVVALVLSSLALLHLYWAFGGGWGAKEAVPQRKGKPLFKPGPAACTAVAALLALAAAVVWSKAAGWSLRFLPGCWSTVGTFGVALVFTGRAVGDFRWVGFFKRSRSSRFAALDSRVYSPLCLLLGIGSLLVAIGCR
jgi:fatty acid desaturase